MLAVGATGVPTFDISLPALSKIFRVWGVRFVLFRILNISTRGTELDDERNVFHAPAEAPWNTAQCVSNQEFEFGKGLHSSSSYRQTLGAPNWFRHMEPSVNVRYRAWVTYFNYLSAKS